MEIDTPEIVAAPLAMSFGAKSKLLYPIRCFALLMGLASAVAALPVAALSFGGYGVARLLAKLGPLRNAYEFLSRAYDRLIDRMGQEVLRDPRDTPALRLMVSLTLTAVPILGMQLVLGKPRVLLVV